MSSNGSSSLLKARAVEFRTSDGQTNEINVGKEVILSAGAIGSPKVLELSGVGTRDLLTLNDRIHWLSAQILQHASTHDTTRFI